MSACVMAPDTPTRRRNDLSHSNIEYDHLGVKDSGNHVNGNTNNNNNILKFSHSVPVLTSQMSITLPDGNGVSTSQSLLVPSLYPRERRHSTSSCDSSVSQGSKRRLRRNSSSRLSDFDEGKKEVTLLTFARAVQVTYKRFSAGVRKAVGMLFVSRPKRPNVVCEAEIMEQVGLTPSDWSKSVDVINAGFALELLYPKIYSNVSRKLCMTMSTPKIVRTTLNALLNILFEENVTWGKIVSMFAVAGLFAEECASQGHADYVKDVVDVVADFTSAHLLPWLVSQGGWDSFPTPDVNEKSRLSKLRLLILTGATTAVVMSTSAFLDLW